MSKKIIKAILAVAVLFSPNLFMDDSIEVIKEMTIKDLFFAIDANSAYRRIIEAKSMYMTITQDDIKAEAEKSINSSLEIMKKNGWNINEEFNTALKNNPYIKDIKIEQIQSDKKDLDKVLATFIIFNNSLEIKIKISFYTTPKTLITFGSMFGHEPAALHSAKIYRLFLVEFNRKGKVLKYNYDKSLDFMASYFIPIIYDKKATKKFLELGDSKKVAKYMQLKEPKVPNSLNNSKPVFIESYEDGVITVELKGSESYCTVKLTDKEVAEGESSIISTNCIIDRNKQILCTKNNEICKTENQISNELSKQFADARQAIHEATENY